MAANATAPGADTTPVRLLHTGGAVVTVPAHKVEGLLAAGFSHEAPGVPDYLQDLSLADLKAEAEDRGLPTTGTKAALVERIVAYDDARDAGTGD